MRNPFSQLTKFERILWLISVSGICLTYVFIKERDYLNICAALTGVTALIFLAKGQVIGQALIILFSILYGIISFQFRYYGEMITYLGMSAPIAFLAMLEWMKHPYPGTQEVTVRHLQKREIGKAVILTIVVTIVFYFILKALNNANLIISTISVATSFFAIYLTYCRSAYYALGYAANDLVLIILWVMACFQNQIYLPMAVCFTMFFINDVYGFINWLRMEKRQKMLASHSDSISK